MSAQRTACGFAFTADKLQVLLILKKNPEWQRGKWNGVGGKLEPGESARSAMAREFKEETGLEVPVDKWECIATRYRADDSRVYFYYTILPEGVDSDSLPDMGKDAEQASFWPVDQVQRKLETVSRAVHWLIPFCLDETTVKPVDFYEPSTK